MRYEYEPIEADNEVLVSLIEEEVRRQSKEIDRNYSHLSESNKYQILEKYRSELTQKIVEKLHFVDDDKLSDSYEDGAIGTQLSLAHIIRVIGRYERKVWGDIVAHTDGMVTDEWPLRLELINELRREYWQKISTGISKYKGDLSVGVREYYEELLYKAFRDWERKRANEDIEDLRKLYEREVEMHIQYYLDLVLTGGEKRIDFRR